MSESDLSPFHRYEPRESPIPSGSVYDKVKFNVGDETDPLVKEEEDNFKPPAVYRDLPRPSLTSFTIPSGADLSRPSLTPYFEKRQSIYFDSKSTHDTIPVLVELFDLQVSNNTEGATSWEETARWIKYEEDVEGVDHHWGRPHVAFLTFHSLVQLRHCFSKGLLLLDVASSSYTEICEKIAASMKKRFHIDDESSNAVLNALSQTHKHVPEHHLFFKSFTQSSSFVDPSSPTNKTINENALSSPDKVLTSFVTRPELQKRHSEALPHVPSSGSFKHPKRLSKQISFLKSAVLSQNNEEHASTDVLRKIPQHAECAQVFVGALSQLRKVRFAMVRLANAVTLPELLDAPIPIRFIFVILGPSLPDVDYHELGRSIATLMANEHFKEIAYSAMSTEALLLAMDDFVDESIVVPPGEIDHRSLISVDDIKKALRRRKKRKEEFQKLHEPELTDAYETSKKLAEVVVTKNGVHSTKIVGKRDYDNSTANVASSTMKRRDPLQRTGRLFGGLIEDIRGRYAIYKSDFTDALHFQVVTSLVFMFFAAFSPAIGFGGLLGEKTNGMIGTSETLIAQCVCGVIWGLVSCQPMLVMAATGPVLVFEASLYKFCDENDVEFLVFRVWVAFWVLVICTVCVMFEGSFMVRYVTRFTEDIFATLIPLLFVYESLKFMVKNFVYHPLHPVSEYCVLNNITQIVEPYPLYAPDTLIPDSFLTTVERALTNILPPFLKNASNLGFVMPLVLGTLRNYSSSVDSSTAAMISFNYENVSSSSVALLENRENVNISSGSFDSLENLTGEYHHRNKSPKNQPDTALLSSILLLATFVLAFKLRTMRNSYFFGRTLRRAVGDFGVPIAILTVVVVYMLFFQGPYLQHLEMPDSFSTTIPGRGWFVSPFGSQSSLPVWVVFAAIVPAFFVFILFFVEIEITQALLSMNERGLKKSMGFHFDLALLGTCTLLCSLLGLPWMCAATVQSLTHCSSLTVMKRHAPGERAQVDYVIEQRVTTIAIALLTGCCAFLGFILKNIPLAVLFGIFLYLGIVNMLGVQFLHRLILMIVPQKYYPDYPYCQQVSMWRMHFYTFVQLLCLIILWICKSVQITSLAFPFVLMLIALFRKFVVPKLFEPRELDALDAHAESEKEHEEEEDFYSDAGWPM